MPLNTAPIYPRPVPIDVLSRDVEQLAAEVITGRGSSGGGTADPTSIVKFANEIAPLAGSPTTSSVGGYGTTPTFGLSATVNATVGVVVKVPSSWTTYTVSVIGAVETSGQSGAVALRLVTAAGGVGDSLGNPTVQPLVITTAGAYATLQEIVLATGLASPSASAYLSLAVQRRGQSEGGDTLDGSPWGVVAIVVKKAS